MNLAGWLADWVDAAVVGFARTEQSVSATLPPARCRCYHGSKQDHHNAPHSGGGAEQHSGPWTCWLLKVFSLAVSCLVWPVLKTNTNSLLSRPAILKDALLWRRDVRREPGWWSNIRDFTSNATHRCNGQGGDLASRTITLEGKRFYLDVKENQRGRFIKIAEMSADGRKEGRQWMILELKIIIGLEMTPWC